MTLDGATVDAGQIAGPVKTLNVISRQGETHCESSSFGVSTGGDFCISQQASDSRVLNEAAGIHVQDSINGTPSEFTVGTLNSVGGKIASDGVNNFTADRVNAKDLEDFQECSGFGINGNFKNFKDDTQKNHTTISGEHGTNLDIKDKSGPIVTTADESKEITENESHTFVLPIPTVTKGTAEQIHKNVEYAEEKIGEGWKKVTDFFKPAPKNDESPYTNYGKGYTYSYPEEKKSSSKGDHKANGVQKPTHHNLPQDEDFDEDYDLKDGYNDHKVDLTPMEAHGRGRVEGYLGNDEPSYINDWPERLQYEFRDGMAEGQATRWTAEAISGLLFDAEIFLAAAVVTDFAALGLWTFGFFKSTVDIIESGVEIIERVANAQSEKPLQQLLGYLSPKERAAYLEDTYRGNRFLGQAVHRGTYLDLRNEFGDRFIYQTKGPDFIDKETGELIELTTPGCFKEHAMRYPDVPIVIYNLKNFGR